MSLGAKDGDLRDAVESFGDYIARETLATSIVCDPLEQAPHAAETTIAGSTITIQLRRM